MRVIYDELVALMRTMGGPVGVGDYAYRTAIGGYRLPATYLFPGSPFLGKISTVGRKVS